jgi:hypothetical protein
MACGSYAQEKTQGWRTPTFGDQVKAALLALLKQKRQHIAGVRVLNAISLATNIRN